jgi:hypothetical protein
MPAVALHRRRNSGTAVGAYDEQASLGFARGPVTSSMAYAIVTSLNNRLLALGLTGTSANRKMQGLGRSKAEGNMVEVALWAHS